MQIGTAEITSIIKKQIEDYDKAVKVEEIGTVLSTGDGIARIFGLDNAAAGELLEFPNEVFGMALNLEEDNVGAALFGESHLIKEGDRVNRTGRIVEVPVGDALKGRVVNPLGEPIDGRGPIETTERRRIELKAPGIVQRLPVMQPLQTGLKAIDSMIPIGRGQRELIIGDRQTGKTAVCIDTIINQKGGDVTCIYVAVGQKRSTVAQVVDQLRQYGAMDYTIVVAATASESAPLQYIAPYSGCTMGEHIRDNGGHALAIYDDLSKHAVAYRQLSLLLRRPPGREAFPGDVFYLAFQVARAGCQDERRAGRRLADGLADHRDPGRRRFRLHPDERHLHHRRPDLSRVRPVLLGASVRPSMSASRYPVSAATLRSGAMKQVAGGLRLDLAQYREMAAFAQFGSDLDVATQRQIARGSRLVEILKQGQYQPMPVEKQVLIIYAGTNGFVDQVEPEDLLRYQAELFEFVDAKHPDLFPAIVEKGQIDDDIKPRVETVLQEFGQQFAGAN